MSSKAKFKQIVRDEVARFERGRERESRWLGGMGCCRTNATGYRVEFETKCS